MNVTTQKKKVILASDHAAVLLRFKLGDFFAKKGFDLVIFGPEREESVDYPDVVKQACEYYLSHKDTCAFGVLLCGTGIGVSIAANKFRGIYCALVYDIFTARCAKEHNHANFIALGARVKLCDDLLEIVDAFVGAQKGLDRHEKRVEKIRWLEKHCCDEDR